MIARLWSRLTNWAEDKSANDHVVVFNPDDDEHIQWLRKQNRDSVESTQQAKRDWASISLQERLRGDPDPRERVR